jgi:hypothetical protein
MHEINAILIYFRRLIISEVIRLDPFGYKCMKFPE